MTIEYTPLSKLERDDIARQVLETAAKLLEKRGGNNVYVKAWRIGAKLIRELKPS